MAMAMPSSSVDPEQLLRSIDRLYSIVFSLYNADVIADWYTATYLASRSYQLPRHAPESVKHAAKAARAIGVKEAVFLEVPSNYYELPLLYRANILHAPSTYHLCKSLVFENTRAPEGEIRHYMVIVQYTTKLDTDRLGRFVQSLRTPRLPNSNYNMRLASEEGSSRLTGYERNGVCPFGMPATMPVIISSAILDLKPNLLFLGAGHVDWKLLLSIEELQRVTEANVADVSL